MIQIKVKDLCLGYDGKSIAADINFTVEKGDYLCVLGENGSGKSTLLKTLLGIKPALSGEIIFAEGFTKDDIGYLPQQTDVQRDFPASVYEIVSTGLVKNSSKLFKGKNDKKKIESVIERLGIGELKTKCYRELSGGQQQRTLIARALLAADKLLLLDEPVTGLDPAVTKELYEIIYRLNKEGVTVIMVSHDVPAALKYSSKILHIAQRPLFFGKTEDYLKSEAVFKLEGEQEEHYGKRV